VTQKINIEESFKLKCDVAFDQGVGAADLVEEFSQFSGEQRLMVWNALTRRCSLEFAKFVHKHFAVLVLKSIETMTPDDLKRCQAACT